MNTFTDLPANLPVPVDDGACDHLRGMQMPQLQLAATQGQAIDVARVNGRSVIFCYPMTGRPGVALPAGWDEIPGARGCTPQACSFRDSIERFRAHNVSVYGLSTQSTAYQTEMAERLHLPYPILSDEKLQFAISLNLPTFTVDGMTLIKRLTLMVRDGRIEQVFYPVFPTDKSAEQVLVWLDAEATRGSA
jgi:peroxiredoxin